MEKTENKHMFHCLRCAQGVLKSCYQESDLKLYSGSSSSNDALMVKGWKDEKLISLREASKKQNPVINSMETIAHVRKAAHRGDVVVSLKVNHALAIAMEVGHAKMKWSILLLTLIQQQHN